MQRASSDATRKFMEHTDATVRDEDVKRLLDLLSQVRSCTVEVVEAIVVWRDAVSEQRMKLQLNNRYVSKQLVFLAYFLYEEFGCLFFYVFKIKNQKMFFGGVSV